jgi:hypothetical protein
MLFILVSISLSDLSLLFTLEPSIAAIEELESELDSVSSKVLIVSKLELKPTEISTRVLRVVSVFSSIYR